MHAYWLRIIGVSLGLALGTLALYWFAPQPPAVKVLRQAPSGDQVAPDSLISVTFSRPVDRASAERALVITPPLAGRIRWQGETMQFEPAAPLQPGAIYNVVVRVGVRDSKGVPSDGMTRWVFRVAAR
jgi:hypothetical protein